MARPQTHIPGIFGPLALLGAVPTAAVLVYFSRAGLLPTGLHLLKYFPAASAVGPGLSYPFLRWAVARVRPRGGWSRIGLCRVPVDGRADHFNLAFWSGVFTALTGYCVLTGVFVLGGAQPSGLLLLATGLSEALFCLYVQDSLFIWCLKSAAPPAAAARSPGAGSEIWWVTARPLRLRPLFSTRGSSGQIMKRESVRRMAASAGLGFLPLILFLIAWLILVPQAGLSLQSARALASGVDALNVLIALTAVAIAPVHNGYAASPLRSPRIAIIIVAVMFTTATATARGLPWAMSVASVLGVFLLTETWVLASLAVRWKLPPRRAS